MHFQKLEEIRKQEKPKDDRVDLKKAFNALERDNAELRNQLFSMREEDRKKDLSIRENNQKISQMDHKIRGLEAEINTKASIIAGCRYINVKLQ